MKENFWLRDTPSGISAFIRCIKLMISTKIQKLTISFIINVAHDWDLYTNQKLIVILKMFLMLKFFY